MRAQGDVTNLNLVEPIRMDETLLTTLEPPRFEDGRALLLAGLPSPKCNAMALKPARPFPRNGSASRRRIAQAGPRARPDRPRRLRRALEQRRRRQRRLHDRSGSRGLRLRVAAQRYAVFTHRQHISGIRRTWYTIWNKWLPQLASDEGIEALDAPDFERRFEQCGEEFVGRTGLGGVEIWVPVKS